MSATGERSGETRPPRERRATVLRAHFVALAVVTFAVTAGFVWFSVAQRNAVLASSESDLAFVASLKADHVTRWRSERIADGELIRGSRTIVELLSPRAETPQEGGEDHLLIERLEDYRDRSGYLYVSLVDRAGRQILSTHPAISEPQPALVRAIDLAVQDRVPGITDVYWCPDHSRPVFDVVAPVMMAGESGSDVLVAIVVLRGDQRLLAPVLEVALSTGEVMLVTREGEEAVHLSDALGRRVTALRTRVPVGRKESVVAQAVRGSEGVARGIDENGERVIAAFAPVAESTWRVIAQSPEERVLAPWREDTLLLALLVSSLQVCAVGGVSLLWQRDRVGKLRSLLDAERHRAESEHAYTELFENLTVGVAVYETVFDDRGSSRGYRLVRANAALTALMGVSPSDLIGRELGEILPADQASWIERLDSVVFTKASVRFEEYFHEIDRHLEVAVHSPRPGVVVTLVADTTERRRAELALQESRRMLLTVLDTITVRVFWKDRHLNYLGCNEAFARDMGAESPAKVVGTSDYDYADSARAMRYHEIDRKVIETGLARIAYEESTRTSEGEVHWTRVSKIPLRDASGSIVGVLGTYEDITKLKQAEEALIKVNRGLEQVVESRTRELSLANEELRRAAEELERINAELVTASEAKSRFLRSMSHELRTPLNSIIGFSGVILQGLAGAITPEQRVQIEMIERAGRHLLDLINDILDLSRIEAGEVTLDPSRFDATELAREVLGSVSSSARDKGLEVVLDAPDAPVPLRSDQRKVRQILLNLLGNAVKFTEAGRVTLRVGSPATATAVFVVEDTGPGIPPEDHERVFGEFVQGSRSQALGCEGTGLGLAISRGLADALGGTLTIESDGRSGSAFTLVVPDLVEDGA